MISGIGSKDFKLWGTNFSAKRRKFFYCALTSLQCPQFRGTAHIRSGTKINYF